ncbi:MAG: glycoside hydrolase family 19 protein [Flavipsychrobacter sp.]
MLITPKIIKELCPALPIEKAIEVSGALMEVCPLYGINTADIMHEFLARLIEECWEFTAFEENLNYRASQLQKVWPSRFRTFEEAKAYERKPKEIALKVYGNRKDLGNLSAEDGWTFRGSGPIQMTGRGNVTAFGNWMKKKFGIDKTAEQWAEELRTNIVYGIHSACWLFAVAKSLIDEAIADDLVTIVKRINGGLNGFNQTKKYYEKCKLLIQ